MKLCIQCAYQPLSVALVDGTKVLAQVSVVADYHQAENLSELIMQILTLAKAKKDDITQIVVTQGPGTYTGLRLGITTANTWAQVLKVPIIGVPTLAAIAATQPLDKLVIALINGPANRCNLAVFGHANGVRERRTPDFDCSYAAVGDVIADIREPVVVVGQLHERLIRLIERSTAVIRPYDLMAADLIGLGDYAPYVKPVYSHLPVKVPRKK